jgi:hypothetical protein
MIKTLNTESLKLFGVPFNQLNYDQRLDLYRANNLSYVKSESVVFPTEAVESTRQK